MSKKLPKPQTAWAVWSNQNGWLRDFNGGIVLFKHKRDAGCYSDAIKVIVTPAETVSAAEPQGDGNE